MAQRYGAGDDRDLGRSGYTPPGGHPVDRDPYLDPIGGSDGLEPDGWERSASGGWYPEPAPDGTDGPDGPDEHPRPDPPSGAVVARYRDVPRDELRADFGAHLETHYPRLVAQLYAVTLHPGDAHDAVQDAYSRAWRRWAELRDEFGDLELVGWVRRVAIRTSMRGWRPGLTRAGLRRSRLPAADALEPRTAALLESLAELPVAVRRVVVLRHMAGLDVAEIAELERVRQTVVAERLRRGRDTVQDGLDEMAGRMVDAVGAVGAADAVGHGAGRRHGLRGER